MRHHLWQSSAAVVVVEVVVGVGVEVVVVVVAVVVVLEVKVVVVVVVVGRCVGRVCIFSMQNVQSAASCISVSAVDP